MNIFFWRESRAPPVILCEDFEFLLNDRKLGSVGSAFESYEAFPIGIQRSVLRCDLINFRFSLNPPRFAANVGSSHFPDKWIPFPAALGILNGTDDWAFQYASAKKQAKLLRANLPGLLTLLTPERFMDTYDRARFIAWASAPTPHGGA